MIAYYKKKPLIVILYYSMIIILFITIGFLRKIINHILCDDYTLIFTYVSTTQYTIIEINNNVAFHTLYRIFNMQLYLIIHNYLY